MKLIGNLRTTFRKNADPVKAIAMSAYMKNRFPYYGIPAVLRTEICKRVFAEFPLKDEEEMLGLVREMWLEEEREWQYAAILLLSGNKKLWTDETGKIFEYLVLNKSWWDSVDGLCGTCIAPYFRKFPARRNQLIGSWEKNPDIWLQRVCIIHQLGLRESTDTVYLGYIIEKNSDSREFFIQKAIGWSLRQFAKTDPQWVKKFVAGHDLKPLSRREALKNIK